MNIFNKYEGAIYYFDRAITYANSSSYDKAMEYLTKGYKHIQDTPVLVNTKASRFIDNAITAI